MHGATREAQHLNTNQAFLSVTERHILELEKAINTRSASLLETKLEHTLRAWGKTFRKQEAVEQWQRV